MLGSIFGDVKALCVKGHIYLGIDFDIMIRYKVCSSMLHYFREIIDDFLEEIKMVKTPTATHLFDVREDGTRLTKQKSKPFRQLVAQIL